MRLPRRKGPAEPVHAVRRTGQPGPRFNYELFNCNNFNIRYWSWNYRGCWPLSPEPSRSGLARPSSSTLDPTGNLPRVKASLLCRHEIRQLYAPGVSESPSPNRMPRRINSTKFSPLYAGRFITGAQQLTLIGIATLVPKYTRLALQLFLVTPIPRT